MHVLNKLRIGFLQQKVQLGKKIWFQRSGEEGINSTKESLSVTKIEREHSYNSTLAVEQEQFCALPRMELYEAEVGHDRS